MSFPVRKGKYIQPINLDSHLLGKPSKSFRGPVNLISVSFREVLFGWKHKKAVHFPDSYQKEESLGEDTRTVSNMGQSNF